MTPIETVTDFIESWGPTREILFAAIREYLLPDTVWENVGLATTTGPEEAIALLVDVEGKTGFCAIEGEIRHVAAAGNVVLTERIDWLIMTDTGEKVEKPVHVMGIFEVRDGKIAAWRDYFDTASLNIEGVA